MPLPNALKGSLLKKFISDAVELRRHRDRPPTPEVLVPDVRKMFTADPREFLKLCCKPIALPLLQAICCDFWRVGWRCGGVSCLSRVE